MKKLPILFAALLPISTAAGTCSNSVILAVSRATNTVERLLSNTFPFKRRAVERFAELGNNPVLYINDLDDSGHKNFLMALNTLDISLSRSSRRLPIPGTTIYSVNIVDRSKQLRAYPVDYIDDAVTVEIPYDAPMKRSFAARLFVEMAKLAIKDRTGRDIALSAEDGVGANAYADALAGLLGHFDEGRSPTVLDRIESFTFTGEDRTKTVQAYPNDDKSRFHIVFPIHLSPENLIHRLSAALSEAEILELLTKKYGRRGHGSDIGFIRPLVNEGYADEDYVLALKRLVYGLENYRRGESMDIFKHLGSIHLVADSVEPFIQRYDSYGGDKFFALYIGSQLPVEFVIRDVAEWLRRINDLPPASAQFIRI